eukprot:1161866-Pelagomonas_calceolata.AAC.12
MVSRAAAGIHATGVAAASQPIPPLMPGARTLHTHPALLPLLAHCPYARRPRFCSARCSSTCCQLPSPPAGALSTASVCVSS